MDHRTVKVPDVNSKLFPLARESGFTIVEMMVGVLIGLIAIVVMFQVFAVSEAQKRTTAGAGEAQQNGVTSLYLLEREARISGYGLGYLPLLGCNTWGYYAPLAQKFNFRMAPVVITNGLGGTEPDKLTVLYGNTDQFQMPGAVTWPTGPAPAKPPGPTIGYVTTGEAPYQFKNGDLVVLGEAVDARPPLNPSIAANCTMFQVTRQEGEEATRMYYNDLSFIDETGASRAADFNPPLGIMPAPDNVGYTRWREDTRTGGRVTNLGQNPVANRYELVNNQLIATNILNPSQPPVIVSDGIVQFQAQYGYSSNCPSFGWTGAPPISPVPVNPPAGYIPPCSISSTAPSVPALVTTWPPAPNRDMWADSLNPVVTTPNNWRQIIAVRFVVVARSAEMERKDPVTGQCTATTVEPHWTGADNRVLDVQTANPTDWMCYRYRTFEGVVPIRNIIWSPDPAGSSSPPA